MIPPSLIQPIHYDARVVLFLTLFYFFILFIIYTFFVWFSFFCVRNGFKGDQKMIKQVFVKSILKVDTIKVGNIHV